MSFFQADEKIAEALLGRCSGRQFGEDHAHGHGDALGPTAMASALPRVGSASRRPMAASRKRGAYQFLVALVREPHR
jgi:hypothetical protein